MKVGHCLSEMNLPVLLVGCYSKVGITELFDWQADCLKTAGVSSSTKANTKSSWHTDDDLLKNNKAKTQKWTDAVDPELLVFLQKKRHNLVYSAPTGAGKTLVAEILLLKSVMETRRKALFILPFISLVREKMVYLKKLCGSLGVRVKAYMGTTNPPGGVRTFDIAVCTIEKANGLFNRLIEEGQLWKIGCIVVDELHMVSDPHRGYLLELILTKALFLTSRDRQREDRNLPPSSESADDDGAVVPVDIQLIGMSATISNLEDLGSWLNADVFRTTFRPVELTESLAINGQLYNRQLELLPASRQLKSEYSDIGEDKEDGVIGFTLDTVLNGGNGVLIFCSAKSWCEKLALRIAKSFHRLLKSNGSIGKKLANLLSYGELSKYVNGFGRLKTADSASTLLRTLPFAVSYHHAGLTMEEREYVETGFKKSILKVIVATSTLSSGVNLPAKRVIIRSSWAPPSTIGSTTVNCLTTAVYRQMIGRAGRKGIDSSGESVLICNANDLKQSVRLINSELPPLKSAMSFDGDGKLAFERALMEAVVGGLIRSVDEAIQYMSSTLFATLYVSAGGGTESFTCQAGEAIEICFSKFLSSQFVSKTASSNCEAETSSPVSASSFSATQLGSAALASALGPLDSLFVYEDLKKASESLCLDSELHMVYLVTPVYMCDQWGADFDWRHFHDLWCRFSPAVRRVAQRVGVNERFLTMKTAAIGSKRQMSEDDRTELTHKRFYTSLALHATVNEQPLDEIAKEYACSRGFLQSLQQQASNYAGMVVVFCERLGWYYLKTILDGFAERLAFGVRRDLTELIRLDGLDGSRARAFHSSGIKTIKSLSKQPLVKICSVLAKAVPFVGDGVNEKTTWLHGQGPLRLEEASSLLRQNAVHYLSESSEDEDGGAAELTSPVGTAATDEPPSATTPMIGFMPASVLFERTLQANA